MRKNLFLKILAAVTFTGMIWTNYAANSLPLNGLDTGRISDMFHNQFVPAGVTFSIWGIIYLLLLAHMMLVLIKGDTNRNLSYFILTSLLNSAWLFAWHYLLTWVSVMVMTGLFCVLSRIKTIQILRDERPLKISRWAFSAYFGWIQVAILANITAFLVDLGFKPASGSIWAVMMIFVAAVLSIWNMNKRSDLIIPAVALWAFAGIILRQVHGEDKLVMIAAAAGMVLLTAAGWIYIKKRRR